MLLVNSFTVCAVAMVRGGGDEEVEKATTVDLTLADSRRLAVHNIGYFDARFAAARQEKRLPKAARHRGGARLG